MLCFLCFLLSGSFCLGSDVRDQTSLLDSQVTLSCSHAAADVTWSRYKDGKKVILVSNKQDREFRPDRRFGSQADGALVIQRVQHSDESLYFCNNKKEIYLRVTSDPTQVFETKPQPDGPSVGLGADQEDPEPSEPSDSWRIPVGVTAGAALMFLFIFLLRVCSARRGQQRNRKRTSSETVYHEIQFTSVRPESESPYYSSIPTPVDPYLYSTVKKPAAPETTVYFLVQNPEREEPQSPGSI
ncbi:uncharacterized protein LOC106535422 [Austrofundulus limnaeus]|uniref:Uncharacterized protein LOC106535422 n=1 Tax=Austrofundulus limnaeus TaxID=52670 RepID=A0A2I4D6K7_AUSLI|nr:PREDICTED: uncharacterized protein LOC106535422 [Austrofundulus limnaeus]